MKLEQRNYGCGCKGGTKNAVETTTTTTQPATTATQPVIVTSNGS